MAQIVVHCRAVKFNRGIRKLGLMPDGVSTYLDQFRLLVWEYFDPFSMEKDLILHLRIYHDVGQASTPGDPHGERSGFCEDGAQWRLASNRLGDQVNSFVVAMIKG